MDQIMIVSIVMLLHNLFTAIWIGGMFTLLFTVLPTLKKELGQDPKTQQLVLAIQKRLSLLVYFSILILLVTGLMLANRSPLYSGVLSTSNSYSLWLTVKHILYALMIVVAVARSQLIDRMSLSKPQNQKVKMFLLVTNVCLAVIVLFLSGYILLVREMAVMKP